jgi:3-hydroxy-9,10-secoandrosta-1,3,5(10)-triene-9,17-dione monooxygenase reductase component
MSSQSSPITPEEFRRVCGHYATGVGVVTAVVEGAPVGLSINSFTSVSLEPLLVSFYAAHTSTTWAQMKNSDSFAVNILSESQHDLISTFSKKGIDRFANLDWSHSPITGSPLLPNTSGWIDCRVTQVHDIGDHYLVVGEVLDLYSKTDEGPLLYYKGKIASLAS